MQLNNVDAVPLSSFVIFLLLFNNAIGFKMFKRILMN